MSKDYHPTNAGSFKIGDFVRYRLEFCKKFPHAPPIRHLKGEVVGLAELGLVKICEVRWDNELDFIHSVCYDNLEPWEMEF